MVNLQFVPREAWSNRPGGNVPELNLPVRLVFFAYTQKDYTSLKAKTSPGTNCSTLECMQELDFILSGDMWKRPDIRYNFMIGPDGNIYEGRGWKRIPRLPIKFFKRNFGSLYITFVGDFSKELPSKELLQLREQFLRYGVEKSFIRPRFHLVTLPDPWGHYLKPDTHMY